MLPPQNRRDLLRLDYLAEAKVQRIRGEDDLDRMASVVVRS
jgi:hypothetical protein